MEILFSAMLFALVGTVTPGPNNIMIMTSGLNFGVTRTVPHWLGVCLGFPLMVIAVGLGMGVLFNQLPLLQFWIKLLGISYLLYLACRIATTSTFVDRANPQRGRPMTFAEALLFQWVNPKAWVMSIGGLAAFSTAQAGMFVQSLWIALAFFCVGFPSVGAWLLGGAVLRRWLSQPRQRRAFNIIMAILLVLSILPMLDVPVQAPD